MSKNINENLIGQNTINNIEDNKNGYEIKLNPEEPEIPINEKDPKILNNNIQSNISDDKNILFSELTNREKNNNKNNINNMNENAKNKIFNVIYRHTHDSQAKDNISQSIITSFINCLLKFINYIILKKLNKKDIFNIDHKIKSKIKLANILELKVKEILAFQSKDILNNKIEKQIEEIQKNDSSLNKLFETPAIILFKDIYYNENQSKLIDLKKYGIDELNFEINEEIPTYEKLKEKFKDNLLKVNKMNEVIQKFVKNKKFKIEKIDI